MKCLACAVVEGDIPAVNVPRILRDAALVGEVSVPVSGMRYVEMYVLLLDMIITAD